MNLIWMSLWTLMLLAGVYAMQWGAARAVNVLDGVRGRLGLHAASAGALMGLATAMPEVSVNVASVAFKWPDLGLGAALGSNVPALPFAFLLSWAAVRFSSGREAKPVAPGEVPPEVNVPPDPGHTRPRIAPDAASVQAWPYLATVLLLGLLTLPPAWEGLQPMDGAILCGAWLLYFGRALVQRRGAGRAPETIRWSRLLAGVPAIGLGALLSVLGAQRLGGALGIPDLVSGLFLIGLLCALPESLAAWKLGREGQATFAVSGAMGDGVVSLTLALAAPALVSAGVGDRPLYLLNLGFLAAVLTVFIVLNDKRWGEKLGAAKVTVFGGGYLIYLALTAAILVA